MVLMVDYQVQVVVMVDLAVEQVHIKIIQVAELVVVIRVVELLTMGGPMLVVQVHLLIQERINKIPHQII